MPRCALLCCGGRAEETTNTCCPALFQAADAAGSSWKTEIFGAEAWCANRAAAARSEGWAPRPTRRRLDGIAREHGRDKSYELPLPPRERARPLEEEGNWEEGGLQPRSLLARRGGLGTPAPGPPVSTVVAAVGRSARQLDSGLAAEVLARLPRDEVDDYDVVKRALLERYRLSAEAFRRRFRNGSKRSSESFIDFAYSLKCNLTEWLKGEKAFGDHDKVVELICTEQLLNSLSEETRLWVLDQPGEKNLERTAELAEEYSIRRGEEKDRYRPAKKPYRENPKQPERNGVSSSAPGKGRSVNAPVWLLFCR
ncbi:hypothetical protein HPB52_008137 [Rhipicephalus sanguineus]|uniref:SCAN box domain-containing protein n=1 Tax=Rhipicephalus sanguineus TaxID=34632 RepID=A0A9D4SWQ7_RHISA|nr:hypothetical protein HPB52_008137 [Rhipicephalus sanguineus]